MGEAAALSAAVFWAVASLIYTGLGRRISAPSLNLLKSLIALVLLLGTLVFLEGSLWPEELRGMDLLWIAASGLVGLAIGDTAFFYALTKIGPRRSLLLWSLAPPITAVLATFFLDEPITIVMTLGMGLTLGGVAWVITERSTESEGAQPFGKAELIGISLALLAAFSQAAANIMIKLDTTETSALGVSMVRLAFGVLGMGIVVAFLGRMRELAFPVGRPRLVTKLFIACFLGTYLGIWLSTLSLDTAYAGVASTLASTSPIFILPLAWLIVGERFTARSVVGAVVAVAGIGLLFVGGPELRDKLPMMTVKDAPIVNPIDGEASGM